MANLIRGDRLTKRQIEQVFAAYVYRHHAIGEGLAYRNEWAWLFDHAFYFVKNGSRLAANRPHAVPAWMADMQCDRKHIDQGVIRAEQG